MFYNTPANSFFLIFTTYIITFIGLYLAFHDIIPDYSSSVTYIWFAKFHFWSEGHENEMTDVYHGHGLMNFTQTLTWKYLG